MGDEPIPDPDSEALLSRELEARSLFDDHDRIAGELEVARLLLAPRGGRPARLLDIGCGPAPHHLAELIRTNAGAEALGVDRSRAFLRFAVDELTLYARRPGYESIAGRVMLVEADMRGLPFPTASFDFIGLFGNSFGYFNDAGNLRVLRGIRRLLRPGGSALITVPHYPFVAEYSSSHPLTWVEEARTSRGTFQGSGQRSFDPATQRSTGRFTLRGLTTGGREESPCLPCAVYPFDPSYGPGLCLTEMKGAAGFTRIHLFPLSADRTRNGKGLMSRMDCIGLFP